MRRIGTALAAAWLVLLAGCASMRPMNGGGETADEDEGRSVLTHALLYVPNRVLDVLDVARAGVAIGPGVGFDARVTEPASLTVMSRSYVGVGYQTLRHLPVVLGAESGVGASVVDLDADVGGWYRSFYDVRLEAHVAIVGVHAALEPKELLDAVLGLLLIDIADDDL